MDHKSVTAYSWVLNTTAIEILLTKLCFREKVIQYVCQAAQGIAQSDEVPEFLQFCNSWQEVIKQQSAQDFSSQWQALAAVSAFPEAIEKHRARDVPWEITKATLLDFDRRMEENYVRYGKWEFSNLSWMRNHVSGRFFEIGRLQYIPGPFGYLFRIYRDLNTKAVTALALPGLHCSEDGWPRDDASAFETELKEKEDGITGYPASPYDGSVCSRSVTLAAGSPLLIDDRSTIVHIHIPWGGKLEREKCVASLQEAKVFFEKYFPDIHVSAFCTSTWLLDRELGKVLPAASNIVSFGRLFRPMAQRNATDRQLLERVFGREASWENCEASNSLQKAVLGHHHKGGQFRNIAGFILPDDINAL